MKKPLVLLIEDNKIQSRVLSEELEDEGIEVRQAFDGEEGLAAARTYKPDLIVLDLNLPKKHGLAVAEALQEDYTTKNIPILILTSSDAKEDQIRTTELGASGYMVKTPVALSQIIQGIKGFLKLP